jgi:hypothetical protein
MAAARDAYTSPRFCEQIGKDPAAVIEAGRPGAHRAVRPGLKQTLAISAGTRVIPGGGFRFNSTRFIGPLQFRERRLAILTF